MNYADSVPADKSVIGRRRVGAASPTVALFRAHARAYTHPRGFVWTSSLKAINWHRQSGKDGLAVSLCLQ